MRAIRRSRTTLAVATAVLAVAGTAAFAQGSPAGASTSPTSVSQLGSAIPADVVAASSAPGSSWQPEAATYGVGKTLDEPVTMSDGTVLRADVYYPTDPDGRAATGPFPVVLTQTPYGKGELGAGASLGIGSQTGPDPYLVQRGYIDVVADVRGTGDSQGEFGLFDPVQDSDGVTLVQWAAQLPDSDGKVGLYGASYLGINQLLTAADEPANSPLKAIFPVVPGNDLYKDTATMGGLVDLEFDAFYLGLTGGLNTTGPLVEGLENPKVLLSNLSAEADHLKDLVDFDAQFTAQTLTGGATAFDGTYWHDRSPADVLDKIVANDIPAYLVGGEFDLFQRGEPLDYVGLQNAYAGRPTTAPMLPTQAPTGRYQLIDGPYTHLSGATADLDPLQLEWFDTWLKGEDTGMATTPTPLHYYDIGAKTWTEHAQYPFPNATPTRFYFDQARSGTAHLSLQDRSLSTSAPTTSAQDTVLWSPVGNPCGRPSDQWSAGILSLVTSYVAPDSVCVDDDRIGELGLDRATYTSAPLTSAQTIAGPIDVTVYAKSTTPETEWVAEVEDVAPNGRSTPLTEGALLGSLRAVDESSTWRGADGEILQPGHTYRQTDAAKVPVGKTTRYDIDVFPTYATIAKGHRIRITLSTADTPHLVPTVPAIAKLVGGIYSVQISPSAPSAVEIPLIPA